MDTNDWSINTLKLTIIWMEIPSVIPLVYEGLVPDSVVKLVASLTADPGVVSLIPAGTILSWRLIMKYFQQSFSSILTDSRRAAKVCTWRTG